MMNLVKRGFVYSNVTKCNTGFQRLAVWNSLLTFYFPVKNIKSLEKKDDKS